MSPNAKRRKLDSFVSQKTSSGQKQNCWRPVNRQYGRKAFTDQKLTPSKFGKKPEILEQELS